MSDLKKGDCLQLMKSIPDGSVDLILCDLPYGTTACKWDTIIPFDDLWQEYNRILKKKGVIALFATEPFTSALIMSNPKLFKEKLTWIKHRPSNFAIAKYRHLKYTEDIVVFGKPGTTYNRQMIPRKSQRMKQMHQSGWVTPADVRISEVAFATKRKSISSLRWDADYKNPMDYIEIPCVVNNSKEKTIHPTQKPVKLLKYLIETYSNEGETVLDNCMGSGSTGVAAVELGRDFIGYELDQQFFEIAESRIKETEPKS